MNSVFNIHLPVSNAETAACNISLSSLYCIDELISDLQHIWACMDDQIREGVISKACSTHGELRKAYKMWSGKSSRSKATERLTLLKRRFLASWATVSLDHSSMYLLDINLTSDGLRICIYNLTLPCLSLNSVTSSFRKWGNTFQAYEHYDCSTMNKFYRDWLFNVIWSGFIP